MTRSVLCCAVLGRDASPKGEACLSSAVGMQMAKRLFQLEHFLVDFMDRPIRLPLGSPITDERALS